MTIEEYAALQVALTEGSARDEVLHRFGLDEASYAEIDDAFQAELGRAIEADGDGIPPLLAKYDRALRDARRASAPAMSFEIFASITAELAISMDPRPVLARRGVSFEAYLKASQHWTAIIAADPVFEARFRRITSGETSDPSEER